MNKRLPDTQELTDTTTLMRGRRFLYITNFADILNRFSEMNFKDPLRFTALSLLITKGGSLTPTELARLMFRSKHSITKIIDGLEKKGYIVRIRDKKDRRMIHVKLTTEGFEHVKKNMDLGDVHVKGILSCLDENEWEVFLESIKKLRKALIARMKDF